MIYKGCQKKMIVLRDPSGRYFEEAYFILKDGVSEKAAETDMVREANRIVREAMSGYGGNSSDSVSPLYKGASRMNILWLLLGFIGGVAAASLFFSLL